VELYIQLRLGREEVVPPLALILYLVQLLLQVEVVAPLPDLRALLEGLAVVGPADFLLLEVQEIRAVILLWRGMLAEPEVPLEAPGPRITVAAEAAAELGAMALLRVVLLGRAAEAALQALFLGLQLLMQAAEAAVVALLGAAARVAAAGLALVVPAPLPEQGQALLLIQAPGAGVALPEVALETRVAVAALA